eukprot:6913688-Prymnesium_polylepis.1
MSARGAGSVRARRLQVALAAAQSTYEDASQSPPPSSEPGKEHAALAGDGSDDEIDARLTQARAPIEQLMARSRQLEQRAERALQGSLETRSLLREVEGLLRNAERDAEEEEEDDDDDSGAAPEWRSVGDPESRPTSGGGGAGSARDAR